MLGGMILPTVLASVHCLQRGGRHVCQRLAATRKAKCTSQVKNPYPGRSRLNARSASPANTGRSRLGEFGWRR
jgi:hypothetical protein